MDNNILERFEDRTKLDIKSIDKALSHGETSNKLVFSKGEKNELFKSKLSESDAVKFKFWEPFTVCAMSKYNQGEQTFHSR